MVPPILMFVKLFHVLHQCKYTALTFHIFGSLNAMKTKIPRSIQCNNMSSFIAIVLVDFKIIAIYELWKSSEFVYYQITQLSEQKYRLAIPFAEHNFGPFRRIFFVIVLFQSLSKTLLRVSFASMYLQICIFYHSISISITIFPFLSHLYQATNVGLIFFVHSSRRWDYRFQINNSMLNSQLIHSLFFR
jgi:hypothetical protein